jgi:hypothetical protein
MRLSAIKFAIRLRGIGLWRFHYLVYLNKQAYLDVVLEKHGLILIFNSSLFEVSHFP